MYNKSKLNIHHIFNSRFKSMNCMLQARIYNQPVTSLVAATIHHLWANCHPQTTHVLVVFDQNSNTG